MINKINLPKWIASLTMFLLPFYMIPASAQITWPSGQLLPSFPATVKNLDLIYLNGTTVLSTTYSRWEAEGPSISHKTGRLESEGWLCQTGIDAPNQHMVYGPYDKSIPAGPNVAEFQIKIDNNTANNDSVVDIDVIDATNGVSLGFRTITRQQFTVAANYTSFTLPFIMPANNQAIELRVFWRGSAYIKVDWVGVQQDNTAAEQYLFSSLKGIINKTQPRIFSYEGDAFAEGPYTWMQSLGLTWTEHTNRWDLISKYLGEISGLIVYDPAQNHTVNLATMLAANKKALVVSPTLLSRLTSAPYNLPVLMDLRGQFSSKLQVYQTLYNTYWPQLDHRLLIGLSPDLHQASLREYATALGAAVVWLDPNIPSESELLNSFLGSMPRGASYMGWWTDEGSGVSRAAQYGIATIASDYCSNLTVHSGMPRTVNVKPIPPKPALQNKMYVAFVMSDGDNLQYVEHLMRKLWNNPDRGSVPIGWTLSPAMLDAMPGALNFYSQSSTTNDNLISGPSGYGYTYPNNWTDQNKLNEFVAKTEDYNRRAGFRVITVWNTITGGINQNVGQTYATYAPSLLGVSAQNTGGAMSIYNNSLPGLPLSCNYCSNQQAVKDFIATAAAGWNGAQPRFILIQAQPWQNMQPTDFKAVANSLNSDYVVVRPDHLFQLVREANGLPIDPLPAATTGLVSAYQNCNYGGFSVGFDVGDYTLAQLEAKGIAGNAISSLKITQGYKAIIYSGDNFTGSSTVITESNTCLGSSWNDMTGSIQIRTNGATNLAGTYYLQNRNSGLYMDVRGGGIADGANIAEGTYTGGANQQYQFTHLGDGTYQILAMNSMKSIDVNAISTADGANVQQWTYYGTPNQQFVMVPTGDGFYKMIPKHSGKLVEVAGASTANDANIQQWTNNNQTNGMWKLVPIIITTVNGNGDGLTGNYFNGMNFQTPVYSRVDANINFDWGTGSPNALVNNDGFSARWTGQIQPRYSETYTFSLNTDNGRRLWINNQLVIDKWIDDWGTVYTGTIALTAGQKYDIRLEYFEDWGGASCEMQWSSPSQTLEVVPQSQLYSNPLPSVSITSPANNSSLNAPASLAITANASDNVSVAQVAFYSGAKLLGTSTTSPYGYTWTGVDVGSYTIIAITTDNLGGVTVSGPVTVTVNQAVTTNPCSGIATYVENNGYVAGSKVQAGGSQYQCKPYPYSGWCNGAAWAYAPGTGSYWRDAWALTGSCSGRMSNEMNAFASTDGFDFVVVPNPVINSLSLQSQQDLTGGKVKVLNLLGVEVLTVEAYSSSVDASSLSSGVYIVVWSHDGNIITKQFVK